MNFVKNAMSLLKNGKFFRKKKNTIKLKFPLWEKVFFIDILKGNVNEGIITSATISISIENEIIYEIFPSEWNGSRGWRVAEHKIFKTKESAENALNSFGSDLPF